MTHGDWIVIDAQATKREWANLFASEPPVLIPASTETKEAAPKPNLPRLDYRRVGISGGGSTRGETHWV